MQSPAAASQHHHDDDTGTRIRALADQCVACGLCLPHCPTYQLTRRESESPRGRIALMRHIASASEVLDRSTRDHCLACGRCERACPAEVRYLDLLDLSRRAASPRRPTWLELALRLRTRIAALPLAASAAGWIAAVSSSSRLRNAAAALRVARDWRRPEPPGGAAPSPATLYLLAGCGRRLQDDAVAGAVQLLTRLGLAVRVSAPHVCCGALERHRGEAAAADRSLRRLTDAAADAGPRRIAALDSGCARELKRREDLTGCATDDLFTVVADALLQHDLRLDGGGRRIGLYRPCTLDAGAASAIDRLLARIDRLEVVPITGGFGCCGAAGEYFIDQPELSARLAAPLVDAIAGRGLDAIVTANLGCRLQLAAGLDARTDPTPVHHVMSFMASLCR